MTIDDGIIPDPNLSTPENDAPHNQLRYNPLAPAWDRDRIKAMFWGTGVFIIAYVILIVTQWQGTALLFVFLPFISAWVVASMVRWREHVLSTCFLSLLVNCVASYLFLGEGILCVVMAFPILAVLTWCGAVVGRASRFSSQPNDSGKRTPLLWVMGSVLFFSAYDATVLAYGAPVRTVTTRLQLSASPSQVWRELSFDRAPTVPISGWLGKLLPPPDHYRFDGAGLGAGRVIDYGAIRWGDDGDTLRGTVQFHISAWEPERVMAFACDGNTTRINKWIGLLDSRVELEPSTDGTTTTLTLTTRYRRHLGPAIYFNFVLDYGVEKMHEVLLGEVRHGLQQ